MNKDETLANVFFQKTVIDTLSALNLYLNRGVKDKTKKNDKDRLFDFCSENRNQPIQTINSETLDIWVANLKTRLGPASVESYKQTIKAFFNWCVTNDSIPLKLSPANHLKPKRRSSGRYKAANRRSVEKIIQNLQEQIAEDWKALNQSQKHKQQLIVRDLLAYRLSLESGKRLNELATLTTHSMRTALKNPQLSRSGQVVYIANTFGKTGFADLRFSEQTAAVYRLWKMIRKKSGANFVFIALGGKYSGAPLTPDGFTQIYVRRSKEFNQPTHRSHSIRHLKGTEATDKFSPRVAATVLNITVETVMQHYYNENSQDAIDATVM